MLASGTLRKAKRKAKIEVPDSGAAAIGAGLPRNLCMPSAESTLPLATLCTLLALFPKHFHFRNISGRRPRLGPSQGMLRACLPDIDEERRRTRRGDVIDTCLCTG